MTYWFLFYNSQFTKWNNCNNSWW